MKRHLVRLPSPELRAAALQVFDAAKASGKTNAQAALAAGISNPTAWRYRRSLSAGGMAGLQDRRRRGAVQAAAKLGVAVKTIELMREHRISHHSRPPRFAVLRTVKDHRCRPTDARALLPYARGRQPLPELLNDVLTVKTVKLEKLVCGPISRTRTL
jgi:hypothetical protein